MNVRESVDDDGFTLVSHRRSRKRALKHKVHRKAAPILEPHSEEDDGRTEDRIIHGVLQCKHKLKASQFWKDITDLPIKKYYDVKDRLSFGSIIDEKPLNEHNIQEIICYGLGNPIECPDARYQLALLLLLQEYLKVGFCAVYDPCLKKIGRNVIRNLQLHLFDKNEECRHKVSQRTLFVMIHCGLPMYENLLQANYGISLENVIILGNTFSSYQTRMTSATLAKKAPCLYHLLQDTYEVPIKNTFQYMETFVNTSFHFFPGLTPESSGAKIFTVDVSNAGKHDEDVEMIRASTVKTFFDLG